MALYSYASSIPRNSTKTLVAFALTRQTWRYTVMPLVVKIPGKSTKTLVAFALTRQTWRYTVMPLVYQEIQQKH